ncbi:glycosyltransferase family 4 protein [Microbacterium sp. W1N]|uniref:glycosyltransferase family 4 protein n=1 Tax=Microbacterium festucae TaxID=2977531 RepID=UPI0021BE5E50|nr:glycosyltransferase family 4 protein [Microbacterium festucae]MCT9818759.1 glycosyltransferase family 4 protein [Microbacterium festucae]
MTGPRPVAVAYDCLFPYTTGGGERQYRGFAEALVDRGCTVEYLTAQQWERGAAPNERFTVTAITPPLKLYDSGGVRRITAAARFAMALFWNLRRRRHDFSALLVSGLPVLNVFAARLALLGSRTPLVVDYLEVWGRRQWIEYSGHVTGTLAWVLQKLAIAMTPVASCHSQLSARRLRAEGFRREVLVSPGLIDEKATGTTSIVTTPSTPPFVLYAGRHIPDKRVESLPAAVAVARRSIPDLRLVILGTGPSTPAIEAAVADVEGETWTDLPGFVSDAELDGLMRSASVLVNPSRREGYGLVVVEAAAAGTPIVLVDDDSNAATELVTVGVNGAIAPDIGPASLGTSIAEVITAGTPLRARTREWYADAVQNKTIGRTVDGILAAFERARHQPSGAQQAAPREGHL